MPPWTGDDGYPLAAHVVGYLTQYEERYELAVRRPVRVSSVRYGDRGRLVVSTDHGDWLADNVISATGTWSRPFIPRYPGHFAGRQLHTAQYRRASAFAGQRVMIVGGGNSAAQILAEVSEVAETSWVTPRPPRFLIDKVNRPRASRSPPLAAALAIPAKPTRAGSADLVTSSWSTASARPATAMSFTRADRWTTSLTVAPACTTEATLTWTRSSGAPASGPRCSTSHRWRSADLTASSPPKEPRHARNRDFTLSATAELDGPASATLIGVGQTVRSLAAAIL